MADAKLIAKCVKEGGKKGIDLDGVAATGGVSYFNVAVETANGSLDLLEHVMEGANLEVDESAEERKGGAGGLGKMFLSAGDKQLAIYCHVPKELAEAKGLGAKEWMDAVIKPLPGAKIVSEDAERIKVVVEGNAEAGAFPLKMRDEAIGAGFAFLREKGLVLADDSSDEEYVDYAAAAGVEW